MSRWLIVLRLAVHLAKMGYSVTLVDISRSELELAALYAAESQVQLKKIIMEDARLISTNQEIFKERHYDLVLCQGPLYHLLEETERIKLLRDCATVLQENGYLIAAFVTRFAHLRNLARQVPARLLQEAAFYKEYVKNGRYTRRADTLGYHVGGNEVRGLFQKVGEPSLSVERVVGCEGFLGGGQSAEIVRSENKVFEKWLKLVLDFAECEEVLGASDHLLVVAKRCSVGIGVDPGL
jgi:S-adenosylmethionine-dependent methyltransferase